MKAQLDEKKIIEEIAKKAGIEPDEVIDQIAARYGLVKENVGGTDFESIKGISDNQMIEQLLSKSSAGGLDDFAEIKKLMITMKMIDMFGSGSKQKEDSKTEQLVRDMQEEHRREMSELKKSQENEAFMRRIDDLEKRISEQGTSGSSEITTELQAMREKIDEQKEERFKETLELREKQVTAFQDDMKDRYADLQEQYFGLQEMLSTRPPETDTSDAISGFFEKMNRVDEAIRKRGRSLGLTDEEVQDDLERNVPFREQVTTDLVKGGLKTINRAIEKGVFGGTENQDEEEYTEPELQKEEIPSLVRKHQPPATEPESTVPGVTNIEAIKKHQKQEIKQLEQDLSAGKEKKEIEVPEPDL